MTVSPTAKGLGWQKLEGDAEFSYPPAVAVNETIGPACARIRSAAANSTAGAVGGDLAIFVKGPPSHRDLSSGSCPPRCLAC